MKLDIVIIDDEKNAIETIENSLKYCNVNYEVLCATTNPFEGLGLILKHKPNVVFLDIEMPGLSGFELLESIPEINFEIIFATAYDHYAIKAIKNNAVDYILKPVSIKEVQKALQKVQQRLLQKTNIIDYKKLVVEPNIEENRKIKINSSAGFELLKVKDIVCIEAQGVYSEIKLASGERVLITKPLKEIETQIQSNCFFRIHRSYLINIKHIKGYDSEKNNIVLTNKLSFPLARRRKEEFLEILNSEINC